MDVINRHKRIAFQFSGGKDSLAALYLLRQYWQQMTVYFCDSGDAMPELLEVVERVKTEVPRFITVQGQVKQSHDAYGLPSDVIPWHSMQDAHSANVGFGTLLQSRISCCVRSIMLPMYSRMKLDGITLVIRGQKDADEFKGALKSGAVVDGIEYFYPIEGWTDEQCFTFNIENGFKPARYYAEGVTHSADCATCTAWNSDNRGEYLKKYHPIKFEAYRKNMNIIKDAVLPAMKQLQKELDTL